MTLQDIADLQAKLDSPLPKSYIEMILSDEPKLQDVFYERSQIEDANLAVRTKCWRGEPFDGFFYIFGRDEEGRALFLDLDIPGCAVLRQDETSPDPSTRSKFLSLSFKQWKEEQSPIDANN